MKEYDLLNVPNQDFSITENENEFLIRIRTYRGIPYADCSINGTQINTAMRCVANKSIFTDAVNGVADGVFMFKCSGMDYPLYEKFNTAECRFVFIPYGE